MGELDREAVQHLVDEVPYWHHTIQFPHDIRSPGAYDPRELLARLELGDLRGKRVLDVGARDGFFAFACEELGAEVLAIDNTRSTGFDAARKILGSAVRFELANVYDLTSERYGRFDVVLFLGVLYHLRHPLLALDRLRAVCTGRLLLESLVCDAGVFLDLDRTEPLAQLAPKLVDVPMAQFLPHGRFHRDWTNKWAPNLACLNALLEDAQFSPQESEIWGNRALVSAIVTDDPERRLRIDQDRGIG